MHPVHACLWLKTFHDYPCPDHNEWDVWSGGVIRCINVGQAALAEVTNMTFLFLYRGRKIGNGTMCHLAMEVYLYMHRQNMHMMIFISMQRRGLQSFNDEFFEVELSKFVIPATTCLPVQPAWAFSGNFAAYTCNVLINE